MHPILAKAIDYIRAKHADRADDLGSVIRDCSKAGFSTVMIIEGIHVVFEIPDGEAKQLVCSHLYPGDDAFELDNFHQQVEAASWIPADHPARAILACKEGKRRGRLTYRLIRREEYSPHIPGWEALLRTRLIGIGEFDNGCQLLFLASDGRCFSEDIVDGDVFYYKASSLLNFQFLRRRGRPMLRPDQDSIMSYGVKVTRGSVEVYAPPTDGA